MFSKVAVPICSSFTIGAGGCHFPCKKALWRKGKGANEERKRKKKKIQTKTNNTKHQREESLCTALVKMARDQECTEIKKEAIFQGRGGRREMLLLSFLCIQSCSLCFPSRSVCNIQVFPSEDAACSTANFSLLIMTSFSELPCLDSLQVVCIFPGALQTRGGNLQ